jgi:hypothetical protein
MPCRSPAMPRICHFESDLSRPWQGHSGGTARYVWIRNGRPDTACWWTAHVSLIPATTRSFRHIVIRRITNLRCSGRCETKQCLWWTRRSLLLWCKDMSACVIHSSQFQEVVIRSIPIQWPVWMAGERHGIGMGTAGERHGNSMGTAWYVWIGPKDANVFCNVMCSLIPTLQGMLVLFSLLSRILWRLCNPGAVSFCVKRLSR